MRSGLGIGMVWKTDRLGARPAINVAEIERLLNPFPPGKPTPPHQKSCQRVGPWPGLRLFS
jgi:hypothetical protein